MKEESTNFEDEDMAMITQIHEVFQENKRKCKEEKLQQSQEH